MLAKINNNKKNIKALFNELFGKEQVVTHIKFIQLDIDMVLIKLFSILFICFNSKRKTFIM